jgi:hypothetical protein
VRLLAAIRGLMATRAAISTAELLEALNTDDELPFGGWSDGAGLTPRDLARRLRGYDIRPGTVRLPNGSTPKGYKRDSFLDAWTRYVPDAPQPDDAPHQPPQPEASKHRQDGASVARVALAADSGGTGAGRPPAVVDDFSDLSDHELPDGSLADALQARGCRCGGQAGPNGNCIQCGRRKVNVRALAAGGSRR